VEAEENDELNGGKRGYASSPSDVGIYRRGVLVVVVDATIDDDGSS